MSGSLSGRVVLITGSSRGIGAEVAVKSAGAGATVAVHYHAAADGAARTLERVRAAGGDGDCFAADIGDGAAAEGLVVDVVDRFGRIDGLVNNAGLSQVGPFLSLSVEEWDAVIRTDLTAAFHTCRAAIPQMLDQGGGSIVITSSINGLEPGANYVHYCAAKFVVVGVMKTLALEYAQYGIRVNSVHPGAILTPMTSWQGAWDMMSGKPEGEGTEADMLDAGYHFHALKGNGFMNPQVIADSALYLNSDLAASVTGVTLPVDAGHLLMPGVNHNPVK